MSERDTIRRALHDAIEWQQSLADSYRAGDPPKHAALDLVARYRAILQKRYGSSSLPMEDALDGVGSVSIFDMKATKP